VADDPEWNIAAHAASLPEARRIEDLENLALDMLLVIKVPKKLATSGADDPTAQKAYFAAALRETVPMIGSIEAHS
jgi:hypothetical protein